MRTVDLFVDPSCPYSWITARWLTEVEQVRPIEVRWRLMSLSVLNEDEEVDPEGDTEGYLWRPVRLGVAVEQQHGRDALRRFLLAYGEQMHERGEWGWHAALAAAGLPAALGEAAEDPAYDPLVRASHAEAMSLLGNHIGTPIVHCEGTAFFGPVLSRVPRGEEAGRLWDGTLLVAGTPGFHELKGHRHQPPDYRR
ncbi:2-hydroxychromene-2-carboxylate isomerase [Crossiella equi]|uniref:2-hydroxychromene-2-carboxylate isomerase n=1 Tax=Crossiella equi TaxID=130796 RepID=A0ABS5A7U0_9PSEU|nr:DsbA family protein [Crossiella equi]MBP2472657.1 2-hydroxychromene-2-carboxylate isomerase [Crossiella equi]